jgi:hypothetical protein
MITTTSPCGTIKIPFCSCKRKMISTIINKKNQKEEKEKKEVRTEMVILKKPFKLYLTIRTGKKKSTFATRRNAHSYSLLVGWYFSQVSISPPLSLPTYLCFVPLRYVSKLNVVWKQLSAFTGLTYRGRKVPRFLRILP